MKAADVRWRASNPVLGLPRLGARRDDDLKVRTSAPSIAEIISPISNVVASVKLVDFAPTQTATEVTRRPSVASAPGSGSCVAPVAS